MDRISIEAKLPAGYVLISPEVGNTGTKLHLKCPVGHDWMSARLGNLDRGVRCPNCQDKTNQPLSHEDVNKRLAPFGLTLVGDYVSVTVAVEVKCSEGHTQKVRLVHPYPCKICAAAKQTTSAKVSAILDEAKAEGYQVEYINKKLIGQCPNDHDYSSGLSHWRVGKRCKHCAGVVKKGLDTVSAALAFEQYSVVEGQTYVRNQGPLMFRCDQGHIYKSSWSKWTHGIRCHVCRGGHALSSDVIAERAKNHQTFDYLSGADGYVDRSSMFVMRCKTKGHLVSVSYEGLFYETRGCGICNAESGGSKPENEIAELFTSWGIPVIRNDRRVLKGLELDIFIPEYHMAIEHNGLYSHNNDNIKKRDYHYTKTEMAKAAGIQLITIFGDEWQHRRNAVVGFLSNKFNIEPTMVHGRTCKVVTPTIAEVREFCELYHLQGAPSRNTQMAFALEHGGMILGMLSLSHHHRVADVWLINRICFRPGFRIAGGSERLLHHMKAWLVERNIKQVLSFSDRRYSQGKLYQRLGFRHDGFTRPDYSYVKGTHRFSKQSLKKTEFEKGSKRTEFQLRLDQGYSMIYDCGKDRWVLDI